MDEKRLISLLNDAAVIVETTFRRESPHDPRIEWGNRHSIEDLIDLA